MENLKSALEVIAKVKPQLVFVTGASGFGKDKVGLDFVQASKGTFDLVALDDFGSEQDSKWIVDIRELADELHHSASQGKISLIVGMCDNWNEVVNMTLGAEGICFFIKPDPQVFKDAMAAKARDYKGDVEVFKADWTKKSKMSVSETGKYIAAKEQLFRKWWNDDSTFYVFNNENTGEPVAKGWHTEGMSSSQLKGEESPAPVKVPEPTSLNKKTGKVATYVTSSSNFEKK